MQAKCYGCNVPFEAEREDAMFHDQACKARYWRDFGTTHKHADKPDFKCKICENCGSMFWFNAYADRQGKRVPIYCGNTCRVAAHRARAKAETQRQERAKNPRSYESFSERAKAKQQAQPDGDFRANLEIPRRWSSAWANRWLGLPEYAEYADAVKAFRALNKKHHPDGNNGTVWPYLSTVNAAFDYLKRLHKR